MGCEGRPVAERTVRPPFLDHHPRLLQRIKNLSIWTFIPQLSVKAFTVAVFPRASRFDVQRPGAQLR